MLTLYHSPAQVFHRFPGKVFVDAFRSTVDPNAPIMHKRPARARATPSIPPERIETAQIMPTPHVLPPIHTIRRQRVVLDSDLARLFGVSTMAFNQAIKRNIARFPEDFILRLTREEMANLISQIVISSSSPRHGGARKLPSAFTEHGAIMGATILRSPRAVAMSVYVVRAFVQMREALATNATILKRLAQIDKRLLEHDVVLRDVVEKLMPLLAPPPEPPRKEIGFHTRLKKL